MGASVFCLVHGLGARHNANVIRRRLAFAVLFSLLLACEGEAKVPDGSILLLIELKTDFLPGVEFTAVRTQLFAAEDRVDELTRRQVDVGLGRDLTSGTRVAELGDLLRFTALLD